MDCGNETFASVLSDTTDVDKEDEEEGDEDEKLEGVEVVEDEVVESGKGVVCEVDEVLFLLGLSAIH